MTTIDEYISKIKDSRLRKIMMKIVLIIRNLFPSAVESVKWGVPYYSVNKIGVISLAEYTNHVNLYFMSGAKLSSKLLEGAGKGMRHVTIASESDINEKEIVNLIKQAEKLAS